jgi:hypothetical protein
MKREPIIGLALVVFWVYLSFFSYPSAAWVDNGNVHAINWDGFSNYYVDSVDKAAGFDITVLTNPEQGVVDSLLIQGRNILALTDDDSGCEFRGTGRLCSMSISFSDGDYKYPLFYLAGFPWLYYLNLIAPMFLLMGLVLLKDVFVDKRFTILIILGFSLFGARKYLVGMPMTVDLEFHILNLELMSEGKLISDLLASGIIAVRALLRFGRRSKIARVLHSVLFRNLRLCCYKKAH